MNTYTYALPALEAEAEGHAKRVGLEPKQLPERRGGYRPDVLPIANGLDANVTSHDRHLVACTDEVLRGRNHGGVRGLWEGREVRSVSPG